MAQGRPPGVRRACRGVDPRRIIAAPQRVNAPLNISTEPVDNSVDREVWAAHKPDGTSGLPNCLIIRHIIQVIDFILLNAERVLLFLVKSRWAEEMHPLIATVPRCVKL